MSGMLRRHRSMRPQLIQARLIRVSFNVLLCRLFQQYTQPVHAMRWLAACCDLFNLDRIRFEQIMVMELQHNWDLRKLQIDMANLLQEAGSPKMDIVETTQLPVSTAYRVLKEAPNFWYIPPYNRVDDQELIRHFVLEFQKLRSLI